MIGAALARREDARILRGEARYLDDIERPGLLHAAFVRSPHPHAAVRAVRAPSSARGVIAVYTAGELEGRARPLPVVAPPGATVADDPHPILAGSEVRYAGQPVALVVGESRALAEDAAGRVEVDYHPLPPVIDLAGAERELMRLSRTGGDVAGAFAGAEHVVAGRFRLPRVAAAPIEPRGAVAEYDAEGDLLTLWCSAQDTHRPLEQLSHVLDRPEAGLRVIVPDVGGAFGSKGVIAPEVPAVAVAAMALGRPVKWAEDRLENFLAAYQGRGTEAMAELALDRHGRLLALRAQIRADLGAYLLTTTAIPPVTAATLMTGCYDIPAAELTVVGLATNRVPTGPYRGAGRPDAAYFCESLLDAAARALGLDRVALRRRNLIRSFPHRTPAGLTYDSGDYERCLDTALEISNRFEGVARRPGRVRGRAVTLYVERAAGGWESAEVSLCAGGRVLIRSSASPHGQGHDTTFGQIAAARLGIGLERIELRFSDSAEVPAGTGTYGSRSTAVAGSAVAMAIDELLVRAGELAAQLLGAPPELVTFSGGRFAADGRSVGLAEVAGAPAGGLHAYARFDSDVVFSSGAYAAVVEIERATGRLEVLGIAAVDDAGTIINPLLAHGQVIGGTVQGLGECLTEEARCDGEGRPVGTTLLDYLLLTAAEVPAVLTGEVVSPSPLNPLGAKGIGEGGAIGTLAAVACAVADALGRHVDPPFSAEVLWRALRERA